LNAVAAQTGSPPGGAERAMRERDTRNEDLLVGLAAAQSPDFVRLLQENMTDESGRRSDRRDDADRDAGSRRADERNPSEPKGRADRAGSRRTDGNAAAPRMRAGEEKPGASEASRPTAANAEPAADAEEMLKEMKPVAKDEAPASVAVKPSVVLQANGSTLGSTGVGAMRLEGAWRPIAVQNAQAAPAPAAPETGDVKGQMLNSLLRHPGLSEGKGDIRLHLNPAHLGKVDVSLTRVGERLEIHIRVESAAAEQALREGSHDLGQLLLGKSASWSEVAIHIESTESEEEEDNADGQDPDDDRHDDGDDRKRDGGDDREGER